MMVPLIFCCVRRACVCAGMCVYVCVRVLLRLHTPNSGVAADVT